MRTAVTNIGTILSGEISKPVTPGNTIVMADGRIESIGNAAKGGDCDVTIDAGGATVIPGLIDTHVHLLSMREVVDEPSLRNYERTALPQVMTGFISHGITTVRSTGDPLPYIAELRDRLDRAQLVVGDGGGGAVVRLGFHHAHAGIR